MIYVSSHKANLMIKYLPETQRTAYITHFLMVNKQFSFIFPLIYYKNIYGLHYMEQPLSFRQQ